MRTRSVRLRPHLAVTEFHDNWSFLVAMWEIHFTDVYFWSSKCWGRLNGRQHLRENMTYSKMSKTFVNSSSHSTRDAIHPFSNEGCDLHIESQVRGPKTYSMLLYPTLTTHINLGGLYEVFQHANDHKNSGNRRYVNWNHANAVIIPQKIIR